MEYSMPGHSRLCGTCEFWVGARHPDFYGTHAILEEQSVKGKCWCLNGPCSRMEKLSNFCGCNRYKKWSVLK